MKWLRALMGKSPGEDLSGVVKTAEGWRYEANGLSPAFAEVVAKKLRIMEGRQQAYLGVVDVCYAPLKAPPVFNVDD